MTAAAIQWSYALAPDVRVERGNDGACLRTSTGEACIEEAWIEETWIEGGLERETLELLHAGDRSETELHVHLRRAHPADDTETRCAALLFRLDRLGFLTRTLWSGGRRLASCVPVRPPAGAPPDRPPDGLLRLSCHALARADSRLIALEKPGASARMMIHDRELLPLLQDLAVGRPAAAMAAAVPGVRSDAVLAFLALVSWCGLLGEPDEEGWALHDLLFHTRTRRGYARAVLGKTDLATERAAPPERGVRDEAHAHVLLEAPDWSRLVAEDPPYALVAGRRKSVRRQGSSPLTRKQLSEFLFRTLHEAGARRPYPSGGGCYPLNAYIAVHRCLGVESGLYLYSPTLHELVTVNTDGPGLERLLQDAAASASLDRLPQVLVVLAARFARTERFYGDLSYSLILKEVGVVFQTAMMAATAMGLAACALGCGDSLEFSALVGVSPLTETSVGELILGSLEEP